LRFAREGDAGCNAASPSLQRWGVEFVGRAFIRQFASCLRRCSGGDEWRDDNFLRETQELGGAMTARIALDINSAGEFELWLNPEGRDLLVKQLLALSESNDHFHLAPMATHIELSTRPYRSGDKLLEYGKVLFRLDEWDRKYFPHVVG
jgi:hypothetical protein